MIKLFFLIFTLTSTVYSQKAIDVNLSEFDVRESNGGDFKIASMELKQKLINESLKKIIAFFSTRVDLNEKYENVSFKDIVETAKKIKFTVVSSSFITAKNKDHFIEESSLDKFLTSESKMYSFCIDRIIQILSKEKKAINKKGIAYLMYTGKYGYSNDMLRGSEEMCTFKESLFSFETCNEIASSNYFNLKIVNALRLRSKSGLHFYIALEQLSNLDISDNNLKKCEERNDFVTCVIMNRIKV